MRVLCSIVVLLLMSGCAGYVAPDKNISMCAKLGTCPDEEKEEDPFWCEYFGVCPKEEGDDSHSVGQSAPDSHSSGEGAHE